MLLGGAATEGDVFAGAMEVVPASVEGQRAQDEIGVPARMFGQAHLCAEHGAVQNRKDQIASVHGTYQLKTANITEEAQQVMDNIGTILSAAGLTFDDLVKTTVYLTNLNFYAEVSRVYLSCFSGAAPARETIAVKELPRGVNVEISAIAAALNLSVEELLGQPRPKARGNGPVGKARQVFEAVSRLPRKQQEKIFDILQPFLKEHLSASAR